MQKPDTKAVRDWAGYQIAALGTRYVANSILELCNYIDSLDNEKVTAAQIREFAQKAKVLNTNSRAYHYENDWIRKDQLLDFIDNDPKKPTAEEIIAEHGGVNRTGPWTCELVRKLSEAGLLKED